MAFILDSIKRSLNVKATEKSKHNGDINVLLLGETGVGKSTFINSILNYLQYSDFNAAVNGKLKVRIPASFSIFDKNKKYHHVEVGSNDTNEYLKTGVSATQDVKTYLLNIDGKNTIRLIDTPGMGDTRGLDQDDLNCESILDYIGKLKELHAICFLFKPKSSRITVYFKYCLSQILSRLDKSAKDTIVFIFTNSRGENYSPGDTYNILREIIKEIKESPPYTDIPFGENVFCFDNEAFRFLAAVQQGIEFDDSVINANVESWNNSTKECLRFGNYLKKLKPHNVRSTSCVNEARRMIMNLSQPMAEIVQLINDNIYALERHKEQLNMENQTLDELKSKLYIPVVNLKEIELSQPTTVCTSSECAELIQVSGRQSWHYKQRCHDPCYLQNVPKQIIGTTELTSCAAMDSSGTCKHCNCHYNVHMHIYYMTETFEDKQVDPNINKNILSKEQAQRNAQKIMNDMEQIKIELENELDVVLKCTAKFAHFLQNHAITPFNDSYEEYIDYLINRKFAETTGNIY